MENKVMKNGNIWFEGKEYTPEQFDIAWRYNYKKTGEMINEMMEDINDVSNEVKRVTNESIRICSEICEKWDANHNLDNTVVKDKKEEIENTLIRRLLITNLICQIGIFISICIR